MEVEVWGDGNFGIVLSCLFFMLRGKGDGDGGERGWGWGLIPSSLSIFLCKPVQIKECQGEWERKWRKKAFGSGCEIERDKNVSLILFFKDVYYSDLVYCTNTV